MPSSARLLLPVLLAASILPACSDHDDGGPSPNPLPTTTAATVTPSLGRISNADVEARCLADDRLMGSGAIDGDGLARFVLTGDCKSALLLQLVPGTASSYYDESLSNSAALPATARLRSIVTGFRPGTAFAAAITPLTEITASRALAVAGSGQAPTAAQVAAAAATVTNALFGDGSDLDLQTAPRLWDAALTAGSLGNNPADRYAFYLAALAAMGGGETPALAVTQALSQDLADGELQGTEGADFSYSSTGFAAQRGDAYRELAAFASEELRSALEIPADDGDGDGDGHTTFPNENIVLPAQPRPALGQPGDIRADEVTSMVGRYTGIATLYRSQGSIDSAGTSCTVEVESSGNIRVSVGDLSISQTLVGTTASHMGPQTGYAGSWNVNAVGNAGRDVPSVQLEVRRNKLTYAQAIVVADTSQVPAQVTQSIKCWMADNRAPGAVDDSWNSTSAANASDIKQAVVGTYTGTLQSNNGVAGKDGETCRVTLQADGRMEFATLGTSNPVTVNAMLGGDHHDQVSESPEKDEWSLIARDYSDRTTNSYDAVVLQRISGTLIARGNRVVGNQLSGWACTTLSQAAP